MANSASNTVIFSTGVVKAWCLTGFNATLTRSPSQLAFTNGYNLFIDDAAYAAQVVAIPSYNSQQGLSTGAIPFRFTTPMPNTKYKIFVQPRTVGASIAEGGRALFAHALDNSITTQYRKTVNGFWVRFGIITRGTDESGAGGDTFIASITNRPTVAKVLNRSTASASYQLQVVVI